MIDRQTIERIKDAANIVDVVSEFVTLRKSGANYKGLCPFHNEKTPSFIVSPSKGICRCFSCGKGGDSVGFIMEHEQLTYPEALRWLANKYHIEIKEKEMTDEERAQMSRRESLFIVNDWAKSYFEDILHNDVDGIAVGMQYFRSRGFRDDIIRKFALGYALPQRDAMASTALKKGYQADFLTGTGLCYRRDDGTLMDRFAGRVIFPWINVSGRVCAFGGRLLDSRTKGVQQKYVNSPDSDIYHKDHELYGIFQAKKAIVKEDRVYMVEGYTDVISMHQCGLENVVANSGTALSMHQIRLLHRFTSNITLIYDGDDAGKHAAIRGTDMLLSEGMNIKVLLLPQDEDPDSFARSHSAEEFREYIEKHQTDFVEFKIALLLDGVTDPIKRSEAISDIVRSISMIPDHIIRATYLSECKLRTGVSEDVLNRTMNRFIKQSQDEKEKEFRRQQEYAQREEDAVRAELQQNVASQTSPSGNGSSSAGVSPSTGNTSASGSAAREILESGNTASNSMQKLEASLVQMVVKYGERPEFDVEGEDGKMYRLTVAQYIAVNLDTDDIRLSMPIYQQIINEACEHSSDEGFVAARYLTSHPDPEVSRLADSMNKLDPILSTSLNKREDNLTIKLQVDHTLNEYRLQIIDNELQSLLRQSTVENDREKLEELLREIQEKRKFQKDFARQVGRD